LRDGLNDFRPGNVQQFEREQAEFVAFRTLAAGDGVDALL
jgi:hypothetical protein